jgi:lysophospholipase L1-like esterase
VAICKIKGITPVLMTQMNRFTDHPDPIVQRAVQRSQSVSYEEYKDIFDQFNQTIRDVGKEQRVTVVDLAAQVPPTKEYLFDPVHLTDEGCKFAAVTIAAGLRPLLGVAAPAKHP